MYKMGHLYDVPQTLVYYSRYYLNNTSWSNRTSSDQIFTVYA